MSEDAETALLAERINRMIDLMRADLEALRSEGAHDRVFCSHRLAQLEKDREDHEARIRSLQDGATTFKVWSGLANGGSGLMALIAFLKAWLGGG
jgi:hypothetical protein